MKSVAATFLVLALSLTTGCNRGSGDGVPTANVTVSNATAPDANAGSNVSAPANRSRLVLLADGLEAIEANGSRDTLAFGGPIGTALAALNGMFGAPVGDEINRDCGAGPTRIVRWSNGLRVLAQGEQVRGWEIDQPGVYALGDLQVGMTRAQLEANRATFEQSTLGTEWTVGTGEQSVSGLLGDDTNVRAMWAGLTCHMT